MGTSLSLAAGLSRHVPSLQNEIDHHLRSRQKEPEELPALEFEFSWEDYQSVSSRLFDRQQADEVTTNLKLDQLTKSDGLTGNSLFLRMSTSDGRQQSLLEDIEKTSFLDPVGRRGAQRVGVELECVIDIYRYQPEDPLPH